MLHACVRVCVCNGGTCAVAFLFVFVRVAIFINFFVPVALSVGNAPRIFTASRRLLSLFHAVLLCNLNV